MDELLKKISTLKSGIDKKRENDRFNIITALHKERDEVYLHSRIISYLLSPTSGHGMSNKYLELFVREILKLEEQKFDLTKVLVLPNESKKSEYKDIDLLIINKTRSQAIIIENKIDAKDCNNNTKKVGYRGQLERYYNTIKLGIDKDGLECKEYQCNQVYVFYLSLNKIPSETSVGLLKYEPESWGHQNILSYNSHIREWLSKCIKATPNEKLPVKNFIQHYSKIIDRLTHNDIPIEERIKLKNIVAENIADSKYLIENFKHVKWHTAHEFWTELKNRLESQYKGVSFFADGNIEFNNAIELVTHQNKEINHGILFDIQNVKAYVSGFGKLSWGILNPKKWTDFSNEAVSNISFSDFSSESSYLLIDRVNMTNSIEAILADISESVAKDYNNLQPN